MKNECHVISWVKINCYGRVVCLHRVDESLLVSNLSLLPIGEKAERKRSQERGQ